MRCQAPDLQLSIFMLQIKAYLIELCHVLVDGPVFNWLNITFVLLFWNVTVLMVAYYFVYQFHFAICKSNRKCKYDLQIDKATHKKTIDRSFRMLVNIFAKPNVIEQQKKHTICLAYIWWRFHIHVNLTLWKIQMFLAIVTHLERMTPSIGVCKYWPSLSHFCNKWHPSQAIYTNQKTIYECKKMR